VAELWVESKGQGARGKGQKMFFTQASLKVFAPEGMCRTKILQLMIKLSFATNILLQ
jgi:hypothetical protein